MADPKNVLFIMADQLRWDYLSCYGHPHLHTPNIDRIAAMGVRFNNAYVQSPFCGPSRMSTYTGRYCRSHGATWNGIPLRVGERTIGDHLRKIGVNPVIVGKTHMAPDVEGMEWLGIDPESNIGVHLSECGFEPFERDDGLHPNSGYDANPAYNTYLSEAGFNSPNPWDDHANSGLDEYGRRLSGWLLKNANLPGRHPRGDVGNTLHDAPRHRLHGARPATRPGCATCPSSSRTGPTSCPRPITTCTAPSTSSPPSAARRNGRPITPSTAPISKAASAAPSRATRCVNG